MAGCLWTSCRRKGFLKSASVKRILPGRRKTSPSPLKFLPLLPNNWRLLCACFTCLSIFLLDRLGERVYIPSSSRRVAHMDKQLDLLQGTLDMLILDRKSTRL